MIKKKKGGYWELIFFHLMFSIFVINNFPKETQFLQVLFQIPDVASV